MSAFDKRIAEDDIKPGMRLFPVLSVSGSVASMETPFIVKKVGDVFSHGKFSSIRLVSENDEYFHYKDYNLKDVEGQKQYNFHAIFLSAEDAKAYVEEINEGALPGKLADMRDHLVSYRQQERDEHDDNW